MEPTQVAAADPMEMVRPGAPGDGLILNPNEWRHDHLDPGVAQVQGVGMPLRSETEDRDRLSVEGREVPVAVVEDSVLCHSRDATP